MQKVLTYSQATSPVQMECELNLKKLYRTTFEMERFNRRLDLFLDSDLDARSIYHLDDDRLRYKTEHLIPRKKDGRTPLLLIFGNPASHSITSGMFFSPRKNRNENVFWKHLLGWAGVDSLSLGEVSEPNKVRMDLLMTCGYESAFSVALCVYISMPSSAGGKWSGVAGIRRLLGQQAFDLVVKEESARISKEAAHFLRPNGFGVTFQRDAWNGLSSTGDYSLERAKSGKLRSSFRLLPEVPIFGVPPTRLLGASRKVLRRILNSK